MYQIARLLGLHPGPTGGGAYSAPPDPLAGEEQNIPSPRTPPISALRALVFGPTGLRLWPCRPRIQEWRSLKLATLLRNCQLQERHLILP